MMSILYVTTMLHWYRLQKTGVIRIIDMVMAVSGMLRITFFDSQYMIDSAHMSLWYVYVAFSCIVFIANEVWFSKEIQKYNIIINPLLEQISISQWFLSSWSNNEMKYPISLYYNVFVHLLVLHILPNMVSIICVITHPPNPCSSITDNTCVWSM